MNFIDKDSKFLILIIKVLSFAHLANMSLHQILSLVFIRKLATYHIVHARQMKTRYLYSNKHQPTT